MIKNWRTKTLLFFLLLFILNNLDKFIIGTIEFIIRIPLKFNSFMANVTGIETWSKIVHVTSNPILLLVTGLILSLISIGIIRSLESLKNR